MTDHIGPEGVWQCWRFKWLLMQSNMKSPLIFKNKGRLCKMMHEGNGISFQKSADIFLQEFHFFSIYIFRSPEHLKEFLPVSFFSQVFFVIVSNLFLLLIFHSCHFSDNIFFQVYRDWSLSFFFVFERYFSSFLQIGKKSITLVSLLLFLIFFHFWEIGLFHSSASSYYFCTYC